MRQHDDQFRAFFLAQAFYFGGQFVASERETQTRAEAFRKGFINNVSRDADDADLDAAARHDERRLKRAFVRFFVITVNGEQRVIEFSGQFFELVRSVSDVPVNRPGVEFERIERLDKRFAFRVNRRICAVKRVAVVERDDRIRAALAANLFEISADLCIAADLFVSRTPPASQNIS